MTNEKKNPEVRIIIRHLSGSKTNQVDEFPLNQFKEIKFGRSTSTDMAFDPEIDDMVSREHGKIMVESQDPMRISIVDLGSKNGILVNKEEIRGSVFLFPGDIIQLGSTGPEFQFDIDPPQESLIKETRVIETAAITGAGKPTKVSNISQDLGSETSKKAGVGKETVERMMYDSQRKTGRKWLLGSLLGLILLLAIGFIFWPESPELPVGPVLPPVPNTPAEIAKANEEMVVYIELGWKLTHTQTGDDVYHMYAPLKKKKSGNKQEPQEVRAAYFMHSDGTIEPFLIGSSSKTPQSQLIGGMATGSGFVVSEDGFILTNRHVAGAWFTRYGFPQNAFPGVLYKIGPKGLQQDPDFKVMPQHVMGWVPANAKFFGEKPLSAKILQGENIYLDVTFAKNDLRTPAEVVRLSNKHDVAMIKVEMPASLPKVQLLNKDGKVNPGDEVTVMGYPGVSPDEIILKAAQDPFNRNPQVVKVPVPTVTNGNVGRILGRGKTEEVQGYHSFFGDAYQLTINATGAGNSGGPMFDDQGMVIGIYTSGRQDQSGTQISFAVPIKYGMELMGRTKVIK